MYPEEDFDFDQPPTDVEMSMQSIRMNSDGDVISINMAELEAELRRNVAERMTRDIGARIDGAVSAMVGKALKETVDQAIRDAARRKLDEDTTITITVNGSPSKVPVETYLATRIESVLAAKVDGSGKPIPPSEYRYNSSGSPYINWVLSQVFDAQIRRALETMLADVKTKVLKEFMEQSRSVVETGMRDMLSKVLKF